MCDFDYLMTDDIEEHFKMVQGYDPEKSIQIKEMVDENLLESSAGAATREEEDGREIIYLDPKKATEYGLLHEILHIKLHRSGWPRMYKMISKDVFGEKLADSLDNSFDHFIFNDEIRNIVDITDYKDSFISKFDSWPKTETIGESIIWNAILFLDGFLFGSTYKDQIIHKFTNKHDDTLKLDIEMDKIRNKNGKEKVGIRKSMFQTLKLIERYLQRKTHQYPNLFQRVAISPLFTKDNLLQPASKLVSLVSSQIDIQGKNTFIAAFVLKSDKTRFRTYLGQSEFESVEIIPIRHKWQTENLGTLLESENLRYGII